MSRRRVELFYVNTQISMCNEISYAQIIWMIYIEKLRILK